MKKSTYIPDFAPTPAKLFHCQIWPEVLDLNGHFPWETVQKISLYDEK